MESGDREQDAAFEPVEEGGGGQAEGFEQAEAELIDHTEGAPPADETADGRDPEGVRDDLEATAPEAVDAATEDAPAGDDWPEEDEPLAPGRPEPEGDEATAVPGEADEVHSTEVLSDPAEGPGDPGQGPRLTEER